MAVIKLRMVHIKGHMIVFKVVMNGIKIHHSIFLIYLRAIHLVMSRLHLGLIFTQIRVILVKPGRRFNKNEGLLINSI